VIRFIVACHLLAGAAPVEAILGAPSTYEKPAAESHVTLAARARCSEARPRAADVTLSWTVRREVPTVARVDLTEFRDGFQSGRFVTLGELADAEGRTEFPDGRAGLNYYWRLLVRTADGWAWAANGRFDVPICPKDEEVGE
jgi:hypothetical protein